MVMVIKNTMIMVTITEEFVEKGMLWIKQNLYTFDLVGFYGISTIIGYFMPNPLYTYILNIWLSLGWDLWHIMICFG